MTTLLSADPMSVASLGLRLRQVEVEVAQVGETAGRVAPDLARWRGSAASSFRAKWSDVRGRLPNLGRAYDDAGQVLTGYAAELQECQVVARRAEALRVEGERLSAAAPPVGPDAGEAVRWRAARLAAEAVERHEAAATRAAARLRDLAAAAPAVPDGVSGERFRQDVGSSLWGQVRGAAAFGLLAADALAGNRAARDEIGAALRESWRVWEPVVEMWHQVDDGRGGLAAGGLVGLVGAKGLGRAVPDPTRVKADGFLKGIREGELTVDDLVEAWDQAHAEVALRDRIHSLRAVPLPGVEALIAGQVDLAHHEAHGGHTIERHVGKSEALLDARLRLEHLGKRPVRSTFNDLEQAQRAVTAVLAGRGDAVLAFASQPGVARQTFDLPASGAELGRVKHVDGTWRDVTKIIVVLDRLSNGDVIIRTAMLE